MENPSFIDDVPTVSMSAKHIHLATEKNTMGHSGRKKRNTGHVPARAKAAPYNLYDSAALIFAQESKALHTDLEERSKAEAASEKSYMQKMQRLEVDVVCAAVPYFL